jgi:hypothetical protein
MLKSDKSFLSVPLCKKSVHVNTESELETELFETVGVEALCTMAPGLAHSISTRLI